MKGSMIRKSIIVTLLLAALSLLAISCQSQDNTPTPEPTATQAPSPTSLPATEVVPTQEPTASAEEEKVQVAEIDELMAQIETPPGDAVAIVDGVTVPWDTYRQFMRLRLLTISSQQEIDWASEQGQSYLNQLERQVLQQLLDMQLLRQQAKAEDALPTQEEISKLGNEVKEQLLATGNYENWEDYMSRLQMDEDIFAQIVEESLILNEMMTRHGDPGEMEQVHVYHILVDDEATADKVRAKLDAGEDFAALVSEYSQDADTVEEDGELGWFPQGFMSQQLEESVWNLEPGAVSEVVTGTEGYHVFMVTEREVRPLDSSFADLYAQQTFSLWMQGIRDEADIETYILTDSE